MPPQAGDANDYVQAGNDLAALLEPAVSDWLMPADEFCRQPAPIKWMVKGWIQQAALIMVHGPSGGGKTFTVLDWCLRMAQGQQDWFGSRVTPGAIVYLAGEGHHGLRSRIAAWKERHGNGQALNMYLSKSGCDLDTSEGYRKVSEHIRALPIKPAAIVIDTLHRFNSGDENSSQDAKAMLDACAMLMAEFNCTIILVHHTGVSEETQHRARGSSAWRGALDIEISIVPAKGDAPMEIIQRKSKDAELAHTLYATLEKVIIPGWFDEDGEPVTSAVLVQAGEPTKAARVKLRSPNANDGLEAFKVLDLQYVGHEEWRAVFYAMSELSSTNSKKQAFARVVSELLDREEILQTEPGVYELKIDLP
jgi:KaiC/GvpD/RAD55 family RecA-like ATPase